MLAAQRIRDWLRATSAEIGLSPAAWADKAGVAASTVQRALREDYKFVTSSRTLAKLADAAGVAPPEIASLSDSRGRSPAAFLPIRYEVGAGIWRAVDDVHDFYGSAPVLADPAFAGFDQWLERVLGDSMDREYPDGTMVHVVDSIDIGYAPRTGDHVIVERRRGGVVERTVKEVVVTPAGVELHARSHNPRWDGPIRLNDGHDQEDCEVEVKGLVLGSYRRRRL